MCIDEDVELYGDFNTANARILFLGFVKCDKTKRKTCKSDKEVNEWLKSQYLIVAYNKYSFIADGFKERMFKKSVALDWRPFDISSSIITPYRV